MSKFYKMDTDLHRTVLEFILSLLLRSPSRRFRYGGYPTLLGLPRSDNTAKANIAQNIVRAKELARESSLSNNFFVILRSPKGRFTFGDGFLDWLTDDLFVGRISGRALMPLTPYLAIYVSATAFSSSGFNVASILAPNWMIDQVNIITQIYSRDKLYFIGKPPPLDSAYLRSEFSELKSKCHPVTDLLDELVIRASQKRAECQHS